MRHLLGVVLAIVLAAAIFFAASWGYLKLLIGPARLGALPAGGADEDRRWHLLVNRPIEIEA